MSLQDLMLNLKGSGSSGNFRHSGRPGKVGGSGTGGGHSAIGISSSDKNKLDKIKKYRKGEKPTASKSSISDYEDSIRSKKIEYAGIYDKDGNKIFEKNGTENEVNFTNEEMKKMEGGILTHNHPNENHGKKWKDGGSFSKSDAKLMLDANLTEMRAVTTNYNYSLKPKVVQGINLSKTIVKKYDLALEKAITSANVDYGQGKLNKSDYPHEVTHRVWQDLADQGFVTYERTEI